MPTLPRTPVFRVRKSSRWCWSIALVALIMLPVGMTALEGNGVTPTSTSLRFSPEVSELDRAAASLSAGDAPARLLAADRNPSSAGTAPPGTPAVSLAYDAADGYVVLVSPNDSATGGGTWGPSVDTWAYIDGNWTLLEEPTAPEDRAYATMAYDPVDGYVILFGGYPLASNFTVPFLNDTWTFASGVWTNRTDPADAPPARAYALFTWDGKDGVALLHGGFGVEGGIHQNLSDTWGFVSGNWTRIATNGGPPGEGSMAYDAAAGYIVYFGGEFATPGAGNSAETWTYARGTWTDLNMSLNASPPARSQAMMDYDVNARGVLLFGGCCAPVTPGVTHWVMLGDLWAFRGDRWTQIDGSTPVPPRAQASMAFDSALNGSFLFGGWNGTGVYTDTWILRLNASDLGLGVSEAEPSLGLSSGTIAVGSTVQIATGKAFAGRGVSYAYAGLPPGCETSNTSDLQCTPTSAGAFTITVTVTSGELGSALASAGLEVSSGSLGGLLPSWWTSSFAGGWVIGSLFAVVVGVGVVSRTRRRARARADFLDGLLTTQVPPEEGDVPELERR